MGAKFSCAKDPIKKSKQNSGLEKVNHILQSPENNQFQCPKSTLDD